MKYCYILYTIYYYYKFWNLKFETRENQLPILVLNTYYNYHIYLNIDNTGKDVGIILFRLKWLSR